MSELAAKLEQKIRETGSGDQETLLHFIAANTGALEEAADLPAIEALLDKAMAAEMIGEEQKNALLSAAQAVLEAPGEEAPGEHRETEASEAGQEGGGQEQGGQEQGPGRQDSPPVPPPPPATPPPPGLAQAAPGLTGGLLWLLLLYLFSFWLAIGSLSSIQFRDDIQNRYHTTLPEITDLADIKLKIKNQKDTAGDNATASAWETHLKTIADALVKQPNDLNSFSEALKTVQCQGDKTSICNGLAAALDKFSQAVDTHSKSLELEREADSELNKSIQDFTNKCLPAKKPDNPSEEADTANLGELQARVEFMNKFLFYRDMLVMPDHVLTLILAIAMGALGSTVTMTWTFLSQTPNPPFRWYALRPFVGAISAMVIFIFAKAGQMTFIGASDDAPLSPFTLSLLAIAAGLLADRAYEQMSKVSGKVLGDVGAEQNRWAVRLSEEIEKQGTSTDKLAQELNLNKARVAAIASGQQAATLQEQRRISDRLGVHPRLLFTDIPPDA